MKNIVEFIKAIIHANNNESFIVVGGTEVIPIDRD